MAGSGRPVEITFTPDADGLVEVTATFSAMGNGSDWGAGREAQLFVEQSAAITYGGGMRMAEARLPYSITATFAVVAGAEVKCGLFGKANGAATVTFYDVKVTAKYTA